MTRSAARRIGAVQVDKSPPPAPGKDNSGEPPQQLPASDIPWYWRLVLFLWCTSFVALMLYEWLDGIRKAW
jgi:hypothetical protein